MPSILTTPLFAVVFVAIVTVKVVSAVVSAPVGRGVWRTMSGTSTSVPAATRRLPGTPTLGAIPPGGVTKLMMVCEPTTSALTSRSARLSPESAKVSVGSPPPWCHGQSAAVAAGPADRADGRHVVQDQPVGEAEPGDRATRQQGLDRSARACWANRGRSTTGGCCSPTKSMVWFCSWPLRTSVAPASMASVPVPVVAEMSLAMASR